MNPVSLRISVTDRCQMRCLYCVSPDGHAKRNHLEFLSFEEIVRFVRAVKDLFGVSKVRLTGGEPLLRSGIVYLVAMLREEGIADLALTTNAQRLAVMAADLKAAGLMRVNVSLDSLDEKTYATLARGARLAPALEGIDAALRCGLAPLRINTVLLRGYNDGEVEALARWAMGRGCSIRFLELMPIGWAREMFETLLVPSSEAKAALEGVFRLEPIPRQPGETSRNFVATDGRGLRGDVGLISSMTHPFCGGCRRLRLTGTGELISCLAHGQGPSIRHLLRPEHRAELDGLLMAGIRGKKLRDAFAPCGTMAAIGG